MKKLILFFLLTPCFVLAQDDLLSELEEKDTARVEYTMATFKGTRIINGHSVRTKNAGTFEFIFQHRFGAVNSGWYEMFGLDDAYVRLALDYGITDRLSLSLGRNSVGGDKTVDGYVKYALLRQQDGGFPLSATILAGSAYQLSPRKNSEVSPTFKNIDRLAYTTQLLIARRITSGFSLQLMPTLVHKNAAYQTFEDNNQFAIGAAARLKISRSTALTGEYYYNVSKKENSPYFNAVGIGFDIETGGHVFQVLFTNAIGLTERAFITETRDDFFDGDIHFGFNVTRTFHIGQNK